MGPLVPEIIGNDLNFIVALVIGIAFGAILEQAGFSTSRSSSDSSTGTTSPCCGSSSRRGSSP